MIIIAINECHVYIMELHLEQLGPCKLFCSGSSWDGLQGECALGTVDSLCLQENFILQESYKRFPRQRVLVVDGCKGIL